MLEDELTDDWLGLGVARVLERRSDNRVVLDEGYVAPWLAAGEHPVLRGFVDELQGLLDARSEALASRLSQPGRGGDSEVSDFMLLETVNRYMGSIWHVRQLPAQHPERLFHDWLMLACDLATFTSATRRPGVLPDYVHDDLQGSFTPLMNELRRSLSAVLEQRALQIPLQDRGQGVRVAQIQDAELLQSAGWAWRPCGRAFRRRSRSVRWNASATWCTCNCRASPCARCPWRRDRFRTAPDMSISNWIRAANSGSSWSAPARWRCIWRAIFPG
jgi:type VI secretion system protein ImpJ